MHPITEKIKTYKHRRKDDDKKSLAQIEKEIDEIIREELTEYAEEICTTIIDSASEQISQLHETVNEIIARLEL